MVGGRLESPLPYLLGMTILFFSTSKLRTSGGSNRRALGKLWGICLFSILVLEVLVNNMDFSWCPFWVQVHGLPLQKLTKRNGEISGAKIGHLIRVEAYCEGLLYRNFLQIKVDVDVTKPIPRGFFSIMVKHMLRVKQPRGSLSNSRSYLTFVLIVGVLAMIEILKKVDELEESVRPLLRHSGLPKQGLLGKKADSGDVSMIKMHGVRTEPGIVELVANAYARLGVCTEKVSAEGEGTAGFARCSTTIQNLPLAFSHSMAHENQSNSPPNIEELSPSTSPIRLDLKTIVVDGCTSQVFHNLSIKHKAQEEEDRPVPKRKAPKCLDKPFAPISAACFAGAASALIILPPSPISVKFRPLRHGRGKKQLGRDNQHEFRNLYEVQVVRANLRHWNQPSRHWKVEELKGLVSADEVNAIYSIPISLAPQEDTQIWHYERTGDYTIKSGYHIVGDLSFLWRPRSANKVAHWVAHHRLRNNLPLDWVSNPPPGLVACLAFV
ncbi:hypothetical protein LOK49_LG05G02967 [Camellia lanceoleosa]|uniref:Uncharacterized protein n=1 Tax=Camellia lanceoleosa TaxID=1840588 RepID=A0ACC0HRG7_9ERIC|nr:hypothetical protein LOK49_LG05G02967 [Camellia lanceoleosa]